MSFLPRVTLLASVGVLASAGLGLGARTLDARLIFEDLPLLGLSPGGNAFVRECPANHVLTGFRIRRGLAVDGIGIKCRPIKADGTLGSEINSGLMAGGNGGTAATESCPSNTVIASQGPSARYVFGCHQWTPATRTWKTATVSVLLVQGLPANTTSTTCSRSNEPATGIHGKHGAIVDRFGLRCTKP
jgi:hypothetical protein